MCVERWLQQFFAPLPKSWTDAPSSLDAQDAAVLHRLRYLAACPLAVATWCLAALAVGGASPARVGTLGGAFAQVAVLCSTCASPKLARRARLTIMPQRLAARRARVAAGASLSLTHT